MSYLPIIYFINLILGKNRFKRQVPGGLHNFGYRAENILLLILNILV